MTDDVRAVMLTYPCEYCGAGSGEWCVTATGHRATFLHGSRWWQWKRDSRDEDH